MGDRCYMEVICKPEDAPRFGKTVGHDYVVGVRFLGDEVIAGGNRVEDASYFGVEFARAACDFLSLSKGGKFEDAQQPKVGQAVYPYTGQSGYECMPTVLSDETGPFWSQRSTGRGYILADTERLCTNGKLKMTSLT